MVCAAWLLLCMLHAAAPAWAQLAAPALTGHVIDTTGTLSDDSRQKLEARLNEFQQNHGSQIVLLLVPTTQPEDIASYANRVANIWKIGRRDVGDGLLLVVAKNDRKVRIEVAKSLEGAVPDLAAKRIISEAIAPRFKNGDYAGGLDAGATQLMALINKEPLPAPNTDSEASRPVDSGGQEFQWMDLSIFLFFAVPVVSGVASKLMGSALGALFSGAAVGAVVIAITGNLVMAVLGAFLATLFALFINLPGGGKGGRSTGGWSNSSGNDWGSSSSSSDSGGFSSGGGGDFGGGGASGDW